MADIPDKEDTDLLITDWERKQFLAALHNRLFWVGEKYLILLKWKVKNASCMTGSGN